MAQDSVKSKKSVIVSILGVLVAFLAVAGLMYWFQWPFTSKEFEERTGLSLQPLENLANRATEQTTALLNQTPLGSLLQNGTNNGNATQDPAQNLSPLWANTTMNNSTLEAGNTTSTNGTLNSDNLTMAGNETIPAVNGTMAGISAHISDNVSSNIFEPSIEEGNVSLAPVLDSGNIIQPPENAPVLNLVTELTEDAKQQQAEEEKALQAVEDALQNLTSTSLSPEELERMPELKGALGGIIPPDAGSNEDSIVRARLVSDFAQYMVQNYTPAQSGKGQIRISPVSANIYYGTSLRGFTYNTSIAAARAQILAYTFSPDMLQALYGLYVDTFLQDLSHFASTPMAGRGALSFEQQKQMFIDYSGYIAEVGKAFFALSNISNLTALNNTLLNAQKNQQSTQNRFASLQLAYEEARYNNASTETIKTQLLEASQASENAQVKLSQAQQAVLSQMKAQGSIGLSDSTLLYLFQWVARRDMQSQNPAKTKAAAQATGSIFSDLSQRLRNFQ